MTAPEGPTAVATDPVSVRTNHTGQAGSLHTNAGKPHRKAPPRMTRSRISEFFASLWDRPPRAGRAHGGSDVLSEQAQWALLRQLDDPRHRGSSPGFRRRAARAKAEGLVGLLEKAFGRAVEADSDVQDASYHARIVIPAEATRSGEFLTITISNFGEMAAPALGNPDSHSAEEVQLLFHPDDRARIEGALRESGYVVVSEVLLRTRYDGNAELDSAPGHPPTWWDRFFSQP